jgi:tRNA(Ile)-lysidine synthase
VDLLRSVQEQIERGQLLETGATVVVGVSGGADSLCLLHVLCSLRNVYDLRIHVAHLNHCLRGDEAHADMLFVALLAMDWGVPCTIEVVDVNAVAAQRRLSLEEAARQVRYGFLADVAQQVGASAVAVGHNADDQSETVLMHFLRGAGLAGLRGMSPAVDLAGLRTIRRPSAPLPASHIPLLRPLLSVPRAAIEAYCQAHNLAPRFDRSNLDTTYFRNRLRHELLPLLETYNPNIRELLRRTASVVRADYELLTAARDAAWGQVVQEENQDLIRFDLERWRALPLALQRATLRRAATSLRPRLRDVDYVHVEGAMDVAKDGSTGAQATLPQGLRLTVGYQSLQLAAADRTPSVPDWPLLWGDEPVPVALPGRTPLSERHPPDTHVGASDEGGPSAWWLEAGLWAGDRDAILANPDRWTAYMDAAQLGPDLALRPRRPGDRFQPLGMGGQQVEVADFMINVKIPRRWRDHIPLLVHAPPGGAPDGEIAWVSGWRIDERVKITAGTGRVVRLRWSRPQAEEL